MDVALLIEGGALERLGGFAQPRTCVGDEMSSGTNVTGLCEMYVAIAAVSDHTGGRPGARRGWLGGIFRFLLTGLLGPK